MNEYDLAMLINLVFLPRVYVIGGAVTALLFILMLYTFIRDGLFSKVGEVDE